MIVLRNHKGVLKITGPILPHHNYYINETLKSVLAKTSQQNYEVEYVAERATVGFNVIRDSQQDRFTLDETPGIPMDIWLYSIPKTIRKLRYQNEHYIL